MMLKYLDFIADITKYRLSCKDATLEAFSYANGCGNKGGFKFPSTMLLISVATACAIHDIEWALAKNYSDLLAANENFDNNLKLITDYESSNYITSWARRTLIGMYVNGVEIHGTDNYAEERGFLYRDA